MSEPCEKRPEAGGPPSAAAPASAAGPGPGLLLVLSGPSGVGKSTIAHELEKRFGGVFSISATTRSPRPGEVDGRDYWFIDEARFKSMLAGSDLLEHAHVYGTHWYGTPRRPVEEHLSRGKLVILDIDVQGGLQIRRSMPQGLMIFIVPPSDEELLRRLRGRGQDHEPAIQRRYAEAKREIELARTSAAYDAFIINDDLTRTIEETCKLVQSRWKHAAR
jgi:guanylate kinase